jgi:hypothetical protein
MGAGSRAGRDIAGRTVRVSFSASRITEVPFSPVEKPKTKSDPGLPYPIPLNVPDHGQQVVILMVREGLGTVLQAVAVVAEGAAHRGGHQPVHPEAEVALPPDPSTRWKMSWPNAS